MISIKHLKAKYLQLVSCKGSNQLIGLMANRQSTWKFYMNLSGWFFPSAPVHGSIRKDSSNSSHLPNHYCVVLSICWFHLFLNYSISIKSFWNFQKTPDLFCFLIFIFTGASLFAPALSLFKLVCRGIYPTFDNGYLLKMKIYEWAYFWFHISSTIPSFLIRFKSL